MAGVVDVDTAVADVVAAVAVGGSGVGIGCVTSGSSSGAQPTMPIVTAVATMLPVINATRRINSRRESSPSR